MGKPFMSRKNILTTIGSGLCLFIFFMSACKKDESVVNYGPGPAPKLPSVAYTYVSGLNDLTTLGRVLFYDRNLSLNNAIACGSCHSQAHGFADTKQFSTGLNNGLTARNASAIVSSMGHHKFWDGRAANSDTAVFMPVMNHTEMDVFNVNMLPAKLSNLSYYPALFNAAFGTPTITVREIHQALASFIDDLYSMNSRFDISMNSFTLQESQGWALFTGKAKCYNCHNGNNFNGYQSDYENIGLEVNYADPGVGRITGNASDIGKFNVPTLRNIAVSAPYMHDGRYTTLSQVIDHYSEGIAASPNLSWVFRDTAGVGFSANLMTLPPASLHLTDQEKKALEAFLNTLTDVSFLADPRYSNPF
jgi:cytochrome c peroxidase